MSVGLFSNVMKQRIKKKKTQGTKEKRKLKALKCKSYGVTNIKLKKDDKKARKQGKGTRNKDSRK